MGGRYHALIEILQAEFEANAPTRAFPPRASLVRQPIVKNKHWGKIANATKSGLGGSMGYVSLTEDIKQRLIDSFSGYLRAQRLQRSPAAFSQNGKVPPLNQASIKEIVDRLISQALDPYLDALTDPNIHLAEEVAKARQHNRRLRDQMDKEKSMREGWETERERLKTELTKLQVINKQLMKAKMELDEIRRSGGLRGQFSKMLERSSKGNKSIRGRR
jgi:hypothetical protein